MREVAVKGQIVAVKGKASKFMPLILQNLMHFDEYICRANQIRFRQNNRGSIRLGFEII